MAFLFKQIKSPYWWLGWRNPKSGKQERFSTGFEIGAARDYRQAVALRNKYFGMEIPSAGSGHPFREWVDPFLKAKHANTPTTLTRYLGIAKTLLLYFDSINVSTPAQLRREHCLGYFEWRQTIPHLNGAKPVCRNTIILELRSLSMILNEAVKRGWIDSNPCWRLGFKRDPSRIREELSDRHMKIILTELRRRRARASTPEEKANAEYLFISFEIARHQGIRLKETRIHLQDDVDWSEHKIHIRSKTGRYETFINPSIMPLLRRLRASGREFTYDQPRRCQVLWWQFFDALRKKDPSFHHVSFHSTRVTVISRMERAGAPETIAMSVVNHASTTVHRVYRRIKRQELAPFWKAVSSQPADEDVCSDMPSTK